MLDKLRNGLNGWDINKLSMLGYLTLIHFVLSTIPLYAMQTSVLPTSLCNELDRLVQNFFMGIH